VEQFSPSHLTLHFMVNAKLKFKETHHGVNVSTNDNNLILMFQLNIFLSTPQQRFSVDLLLGSPKKKK
jgi:hypothetical protein